ncbi:MAG: peptidoglycan-binding protein, partial [Deltaproteobacteria bacterium]|nr:peptidoglycan-binding protein [Deltaproteobacteria bacterium]
MSKLSTKFASVGISIVTAISLSGVAPAFAQTNADLQAQIAALLAQINALQAQLSGQTGGTSSYQFSMDLTLGAKGADVTALHQILISKGYLKIAAPTGYFGPLTRAAVAAWQADMGITPSVGYFG